MVKEFKEWSKLIAMCVVGLTLIGLVIAWEFGKVIAVWKWIFSRNKMRDQKNDNRSRIFRLV